MAQIREIVATALGPNPVFGNIVLYAGDSGAANAGDGLPANNTKLASPYAVVVDAQGNIYVDDQGHGTIRRGSLGNELLRLCRGSCRSDANCSGLSECSGHAEHGDGGQWVDQFAVGASANCALGSSTASGTGCQFPLTFTPAFPGFRTAPFTLTDAAGVNTVLGLREQEGAGSGIHGRNDFCACWDGNGGLQR